MSETNRNPNKKPNYALRRSVAAGIATLGLGGAYMGVSEVAENHKEHRQLVEELQQPDALQEYLKGDQIPHDKVVRLEVPGNMPPDSVSKLFKKDNESQWDLTQQIKPQVDAQGDPGAQVGEQVVVERDLVDPQAIEDYQVENINSPDYRP